MADEDLVAVVGMAGRFPGGATVEQFWANAAAGTECVTRYRRDELVAAGVPDDVLDDPDYVPAGAPLADIDRFDAALFGYSPREARLMDPQQRIFLECAWHALEHAGCDPDRTQARIGVFAGTGMSRYLWQNAAPALAGRLDPLEARLLNDKDFLATTVSYKLNLRGPAVSVQTACSTSLVAAHLAAQSLLAHDSDLALAGGVTIELPHGVGYLHRDGSITSPDGHCRPFDHRAAGCLGGSGVGVVVLQRLADAIAEGRTVHAVILGSAVNNDGAGKVGFTAPSVGGQAAVIRDALYLADIEPSSIGYVETHGTGTPIGDPIEIEALRTVFGDGPPASIALGSAKATIGHLDSAAGVASLIRAVCAVRDGVLPPSPYFERANPLLELDGSPFYVPTSPMRWPGPANRGTPRRAGVSSFGIGGTNAHVVVEQPPRPAAAPDVAGGRELLVLSAGTEQALEAMRLRLAGVLTGALTGGDADPASTAGLSLADVAHTLATGRRRLPHRVAVVAGSAAEAAQRLCETATRRLRVAADPPAVAFLFPGQGAQRPGMAAGLERVAPRFAKELRRCVELLAGHGVDIGPLLLDPDADAALLERTEHAQPALFAHCYALAVQWIAWGVTPRVMAGHSIGEYVAACLAGVFDLPDALRLVARRGALMARMPAGAMLAVALSEDDVAARLDGRVGLAAVNGPRQCVLSGPVEDIATVRGELGAAGVQCRLLHTSHAFHSAMLDPMLGAFEREVRAVRRQRPSLPFASCVTGALAEPAQVIDPAYWAEQARATVRFGAALDRLAADPDTLFVEVGPGRSMSELARRHVRTLRHAPVTSLPMTDGAVGNGEALLSALGQVWEVGVDLDWAAVHAGAPRRYLPLPGYPFARQRYWLDPPVAVHAGAGDRTTEPAETAETGSEPAAAAPGPAGMTAAEATVVAVFSEAFGIDEVSLDDDFFGLGGTSLLAAQVVHRLRREFGVPFPVRYLFDAPQVRDLAALIAGTSIAETEPDGAVTVGETRPVPAERPLEPRPEPVTAAPLAFSLFYFADDSGAGSGGDTYRFLLETATLADTLGFTAVWTPERHFHSFGGPYPNPSVLSAALAVATERVHIRAGSLVLPLHHPVRVCEDWSIVDNLSGGRVGISFATGWHGSDFVFAPEAYEGRRKLTWDTIPLVRRLWRGDPVTFPGPDGQPVTPTLFPRPVQHELPVWITASGNPDTFVEAGRLGTNVLTSLIGQSPEQLAENIARYRAARAEYGHDRLAGTVTVMLHAYLEHDTASARELCRQPLREYLRGYVAQQRDMPTGGTAVPEDEDIETQLDFAYQRYATRAALIGSPVSVRPLLAQLAGAGVTEVACLVDFGVPLDRTLRSIRLLAELKDSQKESLPGEVFEARPPGAITAPITAPITAQMGIDQERMFRLERVNPAGPANYVTTGLRVRGELRPDLLDAALHVVGERHEALRTTFGEAGGTPVQIIGAEFPVRLERHDVSDVPPAERVRAARRLRTEVARRPFRLDEPVLRVALIRLDDTEHQLAIVQHHMITDWVSFNVFVHELFGVYGDLVSGRTPDLPPPVPYRAFAERERTRLRDGLLDDQLDHWVRELDGAPEPVTLPLARPRPRRQTFDGRREWLLLPEPTTQRLAALSRAERVTPFMTAYTALAACLARTSGQDDLVVGSPTANRDWAPEQLMGLLLRPMLLRTRLRPEQSFRSALADVRAVTSRALANAEVPYQALVDRLRPERDLEWLPLFRLRYLFLRWDEPVTVSGLRLSPLDTDPQTSLYDATVSLWDSTRGAFGRIEYNRDLIARDTVITTIERFATMLHAAVADPDLPIGDLPDSSPTRFHVDTDELEDYLGTQSVHS